MLWKFLLRWACAAVCFGKPVCLTYSPAQAGKGCQKKVEQDKLFTAHFISHSFASVVFCVFLPFLSQSAYSSSLPCLLSLLAVSPAHRKL